MRSLRLPRLRHPRSAARSAAPLGIAELLHRPVNEPEGRLADPLATPPPIEERLARLEELADRLPGAAA